MRTKITTPHCMAMISVIFSIVFACSCQRELLDPVSLVPVQESGFIRLHMENQSNDYDYPSLQTKVEISGFTGAASWTSGDEIAYCVTNGGTNKYVVETVNISNETVPLSLESGYQRSNFAIFPASARTTNYTTPTVTYPSSYNLDGITNLETYAPMPMVAVNEPGEPLVFYHVGGLLRLYMYNIDSRTRKIRISFNGISYITGAFSVSNPGTAQASTSVSSGSTNYIDFIKSNFGSSTYLNIPVPTGNYSDLSALSVTLYDGSGNPLFQRTKKVSWTVIERAGGRTTRIDTNPEMMPVYAGLNIAPACLAYKNGTFILDDDFSHTSYNSVYGINEGSYFFNSNDLATINNYLPMHYGSYYDWRLPTRSECYRLLGSSSPTRSTATVNGSSGRYYSVIGYTGNYCGLIIYPDEGVINIDDITYYNTAAYTGSRAAKDAAVAAGCFWVPVRGKYSSSWNGNTYTVSFPTSDSYTIDFATHMGTDYGNSVSYLRISAMTTQAFRR